MLYIFVSSHVVPIRDYFVILYFFYMPYSTFTYVQFTLEDKFSEVVLAGFLAWSEFERMATKKFRVVVPEKSLPPEEQQAKVLNPTFYVQNHFSLTIILLYLLKFR